MIVIDHPTLTTLALVHIVDVHWHPKETDTLYGFPQSTRNYLRDVCLTRVQPLVREIVKGCSEKVIPTSGELVRVLVVRSSLEYLRT